MPRDVRTAPPASRDLPPAGVRPPVAGPQGRPVHRPAFAAIDALNQGMEQAPPRPISTYPLWPVACGVCAVLVIAALLSGGRGGNPGSAAGMAPVERRAAPAPARTEAPVVRAPMRERAALAPAVPPNPPRAATPVALVPVEPPLVAQPPPAPPRAGVGAAAKPARTAIQPATPPRTPHGPPPRAVQLDSRPTAPRRTNPAVPLATPPRDWR